MLVAEAAGVLAASEHSASGAMHRGKAHRRAFRFPAKTGLHTAGSGAIQAPGMTGG